MSVLPTPDLLLTGTPVSDEQPRARGLTGRAVVVLATLLVLLGMVAVPPALAQDAGSIVFILEDDVWIMAADDPATARPVTTDGTADNPYRWPTQDDQGRITVVRGPVFTEQVLVVLDQAGTTLVAPFRPSGYEGIEDLSSLHALPTGEAVALSLTSTQCGDGSSVCGGSDLQATDGSGTFAPGAYISSGASWYSGTQVVAGLGGEFTTYTAGEDAEQLWYDACDLGDLEQECRAASNPEIDRGLQRLMAIDGGSQFSGPPTIHIWTLDGAPPAAPTFECTITGPEGAFYGPGWSPDGTSILVTYGEGVFGETPAEAPGVYRYDGIGTTSCEDLAGSGQLLIADGYHAFWSAAPLGTAGPTDPPPTDPPPTDPPPTDPPPTGGDLTDGQRIDGGGQADPIAQAIATSQQLFGDGEADRVVLATADQFPDALAGAALAGDDGPILYTSGLGPLDPRTRAEIARVTGGDGVVLTLGGDLAVSEQAATEARAAGGDRPCAAPLPSSCRYAGAAREQTAALISATVLAEHPGTTALIARRDVFADAITGGAYAARAGVPILLTHSTFLHPDTEAFLRDNGIDTSVVLGGTAAIDQPTYDAIPTASKSRAAGSERTGTSVAIARDLWAAGGHAEGGGVLLVNVRHPEGWQTALSAAVVAAVHGMPQLGVEDPPTGLSTAVRNHLQGSGLDVIAFGDQVLVSDAQLQEAMQVSG